MEHFKLLNKPTQQNSRDIPPADRDLPINCNAPTTEEIRRAINQLNNNKVARPDGIRAEALKVDKDTRVMVRHPLFTKIPSLNYPRGSGTTNTSPLSSRRMSIRPGL
jgi:SOS-response transcriptional repressor LexA